MKHHTFKVQNIIEDKKKFLDMCNSNLNFKYELAKLLNEKNKIKRGLSLIKKVSNNPYNFIKFSLILVYRKLRNSFIYFIN